MRGAVTTGDRLNDLRLSEHHAFAAVRRAYQSLAEIPLDDRRRRRDRLSRLASLTASWRRALLERDAADGILKSCGGVESRHASAATQPFAPGPDGRAASPVVMASEGAGIAPGPQDAACEVVTA